MPPAAVVGSNDDYVNTYSYDNLGRVTQITQDGVSGGNAVAEKRVDFGYSDDGTRATISRFADLAGTKAVAETEKVFDQLGRVTEIVPGFRNAHKKRPLSGGSGLKKLPD